MTTDKQNPSELLLSVDPKELQFTFARSSGPGGQKVNKTSSQAILKWHVESSQSINFEEKALILSKLANRINKLGEVVIHSDLYRDRNKNIEDCKERLEKLIRTATYIAKPRKATKPSRASKERRIQDKKKNSEKKKLRRHFDD